MKEVFEKIRNGIVEEANVAKADNYQYENGFIPPCNYTVIDVNDRVIEAYMDALSIVSEVEAEYINKSTEHINKSSDCSTNWIPCSERLPEDNTRVLACFTTGTVTELAYLGEGVFSGLYEYTTKVIIAWMPLPLPYQKESE